MAVDDLAAAIAGRRYLAVALRNGRPMYTRTVSTAAEAVRWSEAIALG